MNYKLHIIIALLLSSIALVGQQVQKSTLGSVVLKNAEIYTITNGVITGDIHIDNNDIKAIGRDLQVQDATEIDCTGKRIYPGFVDSGCKIGLAEISSISLTKDFNEIGTFTPHMRALTAVNPSSVHIPITRVNGVTSALTYPEGSLFAGKAALIHLQGYTPDQMSGGFEAGVLKWPASGRRGRWDRRSDEDIEKDKKKALTKLNGFWKNVKVYSELDGDKGYNPQMEALESVANGDEPLLIEVNKKEDILAALAWVNEEGVKAIFTGVSEGWRVADSLAKYDIPAIVGPILQNPSRASDSYDAPYKNAGLLQQAGVLVAIRTTESENVRNLPFNAGFAANYGMGVEEALKAITINPAKIFGVDDKVGSIEEGKSANLFVCDGDPFEMKTRISHVFINGWNIPIESRQTLLYDEYLNRDPGLELKD